MAEPKTRINRQTVNLSEFPDLVVIYLGMRVQKVRGLGKLIQTGRQIQAGVAQGPEGLLLHENLLFSVIPPHLGMRQYWRDLDALERWTRELPHKQWWQDFLRDSAGTGFWHETYFMRGGMEGPSSGFPCAASAPAPGRRYSVAGSPPSGRQTARRRRKKSRSARAVV